MEVILSIPLFNKYGLHPYWARTVDRKTRKVLRSVSLKPGGENRCWANHHKIKVYWPTAVSTLEESHRLWEFGTGTPDLVWELGEASPRQWPVSWRRRGLRRCGGKGVWGSRKEEKWVKPMSRWDGQHLAKEKWFPNLSAPWNHLGSLKKYWCPVTHIEVVIQLNIKQVQWL